MGSIMIVVVRNVELFVAESDTVKLDERVCRRGLSALPRYEYLVTRHGTLLPDSPWDQCLAALPHHWPDFTPPLTNAFFGSRTGSNQQKNQEFQKYNPRHSPRVMIGTR
jgi:hypothetical protein